MNFKTYSFRFADQVLNSRYQIKKELEDIIQDTRIVESTLTRPNFNKVLHDLFVEKGWTSEAPVFEEHEDPAARMDYLKERIGIEVGFGHASFIGIDLLKFQVGSYSGLDKIDVGVYILTTNEFQKRMKKEHGLNWEGSLTFEKVVKYLPHFKSAIQVPVWVVGFL